jgi:hypothetical protein
MIRVNIRVKKGGEVANRKAVAEAMDQSWVPGRYVETCQEGFVRVGDVGGENARVIRDIFVKRRDGIWSHKWSRSDVRRDCEWNDRHCF